MKDGATARRWVRFLRGAVEHCRANGDQRSDVEIARDLMRYYEREGLVTRGNGKWIVPDILEN
jgi:hypothetical protein